MGRPKMIYLTDANFERIKHSDNASLLINKLLNEYFGRCSANYNEEQLKKDMEQAGLPIESDEEVKARIKFKREKVRRMLEEEKGMPISDEELNEYFKLEGSK